MKIVVTGGAGFIGSHVAEFYAKQNHEVTVFDNLSRFSLLQQKAKNSGLNWDYLKEIENINLVKGDIRNFNEIREQTKNADVIVHTAAQTGVKTSVTDPALDFEVNSYGTFNVLEAARKNDVKCLLFTSTNKVYGDNVNKVPIKEEDKRYSFEGKFKKGIPESFPIDLCKHTPYGVSKTTGDIYVQDYSLMYGLRTAVFRMSCIYGTRQFGLEDQGWVAWFAIATLLGKELTIYGDGKQVRDVLYVTDLVDIFDRFITSKHKNIVLNTGGGPENTLSLLEYIDVLEKVTSKKIKTKFNDWRPSDQKVYVSDISKAQKILNWKPKVTPEEGIKRLVSWVMKNKSILG